MTKVDQAAKYANVSVDNSAYPPFGTLMAGRAYDRRRGAEPNNAGRQSQMRSTAWPDACPCQSAKRSPTTRRPDAAQLRARAADRHLQFTSVPASGAAQIRFVGRC
jgi:hypothetical protein